MYRVRRVRSEKEPLVPRGPLQLIPPRRTVTTTRVTRTTRGERSNCRGDVTY